MAVVDYSSAGASLRSSIADERAVSGDGGLVVWDMSRTRTAFLYSKPVFHGHDGVRQVWREALAAFGEIDFTVEELIEGGDKVLAFIREREVGRTSGVPVETSSHFAVWTLAHGRAVRLEVFHDRAEALEAVGLRE